MDQQKNLKDDLPGKENYSVVVIGAGFGGIGMGCQLRTKLGLQSGQMLIVERQSAVGGTWWINKYPGVQCDVPANFYSLSFCQNPDWSSFYPSGKEIFNYANWVVDKYDLRRSLSLNTEAVQCRWEPESNNWRVTLRELQPQCGDLSTAERLHKIEKDGYSSVYKPSREIWCKILISAVGGLVEPAPFPPNVGGLESFQGEVVHSARWHDDVEVRDKDIIVVGTGCSAAQIVPQLLKNGYGARSVTQLMREPPWVVPQPEPPVGHSVWERWAPFLNRNVPGFMRLMRLLVAYEVDQGWKVFQVGSAGELRRKHLEKTLKDYIMTAAPKKVSDSKCQTTLRRDHAFTDRITNLFEKYQELLTPLYPVGCKRRIYDTEWFQCMHDKRFNLSTLELAAIEEDQVILKTGKKTHSSEKRSGEVRIHADLIILANGFAVHNWFHPLTIIGRGGKTMHEVFEERGGPQLYRGTALDGFPNLFILFGPNSYTGHSSVILGLENHIGHAIQLMRPLLNGDALTVEVRKEPTTEYNESIQRDLSQMVWSSGGCSSWYKDNGGRNSASWPYDMMHHTRLFKKPVWDDWDITPTSRAISRLRLRRVFTATTIFASLAMCYIVGTGRYGEALKTGTSELQKKVMAAITTRI